MPSKSSLWKQGMRAQLNIEMADSQKNFISLFTFDLDLGRLIFLLGSGHLLLGMILG